MFHILYHVRFRKGHGPIPTVDIFPFGKTCRIILYFGKGMALSLRWTFSRLAKHAASYCISERAWPYPYGGHFPILMGSRPKRYTIRKPREELYENGLNK